MSDTIAVVFTEHGPAEVLHVHELPLDRPGPREARVRVAAAAVHPTDLVLRSGARPPTGAPPYVPGMAVAGVVDESGEGSAWRRGDRVMGMTLPSSPFGGGCRASIVVPDETLARVPADIDLHQAATLPMNGHTALQALRLLELPAGATIAVTGAAGALGALVVPLAVSRGLRVVGVARSGDEALVRSLGAHSFVSAGPELAGLIVTAAGGQVDGAIDLAIHDDEVVPAVRAGGALVSLRGWTGPSEAEIRVLPVAVPKEWRAGGQLDEFADARYLTRPVRRFAPADAAQAHLLLEEAGLRSSVVIDFA